MIIIHAPSLEGALYAYQATAHLPLSDLTFCPHPVAPSLFEEVQVFEQQITDLSLLSSFYKKAPRAMNDLLCALLAPDDLWWCVCPYLRCIDHRGDRCLQRIDLPYIKTITDRAKSLRHEAHKWKGLSRFSHTVDDWYISFITPRYPILPLLKEHFLQRFPTHTWALIDTVHKEGVMFDQTRIIHAPLVEWDNPVHAPDEESFRTLWQTFHTHLAIEERHNKKLQRHYIPRRFIPFLVEQI